MEIKYYELECGVKAKELTEANGFEGMLDIVQDEMPIDVIEIGGELIEL